MDLKSRVGEKIGPYREEATASRISQFCKAIGARECGQAPPTYLTTCRRGEFELLEKLSCPLSRVLHGEQEYTYANPILPGDHLSFETELVKVLEKKGSSGSMFFMVFETRVGIERDSGAVPAGTSSTTIILRT